MKKNPFYLYLFALVGFAVLQCLLALPFYLLEDGLTVKVILYYVSQVIGYLPPFLTVGFVAFRMTVECKRLLPFWLYLGISLIKQPVLALLGGLLSEEAEFLSLLLSGLETELLYAAVLLFLLLLGYLIFIRHRTLMAEDRFFGFLSSDCRVLTLAVAIPLAVQLVLEVIGIAQDISARLGLIDFVDVANYLFALVFDLLLFFLAFAAGRWLQLICARALKSTQ